MPNRMESREIPSESLSEDRSFVPLLGVSHTVYFKALFRLVNEWLSGKVGSGVRLDKKQEDTIREYVADTYKPVALTATDPTDEKIATTYDALRRWNVPLILDKATSHRYWIRRCYELCVAVGVEFSEQMENRIRIHDLSKYSDKELLGYAVMFGRGGYRQIDDEREKHEWELALEHHYCSNTHHPEYFFPKDADGRRGKSPSMMDADPANGETNLAESIIDMLAAHGERTLDKDTDVSVRKMFCMDEKFFNRYAESDGAYVKARMQDWLKLIETFLSTEGNERKLDGWFDGRRVVF
ncbi:hypothetical protein MAR_002805 [Mya arenaria]|uniref:Uncharacterized protein n=1 Tax=Mya arenaria TaxID=6604 RepID=A0ABY7G5N0_MYAAR|nr:uncharacterized protein LOC128209473 [Mya arenaria]XP_052787412.1 uncharacterized protein LOC128222445 [Mya arenaria]WAR19526.1 hypothetical protein MAR_001364 [Mya arenaria]WAR29237.1 hypothetical protein MAR_002805 [Mya arenaria]